MSQPEELSCPTDALLLMLAVCRHVLSENTAVQRAVHLQTGMLRVLRVSVTVYSTFS